MSNQLFYLFSAGLFGLVIGALIMYFAGGKNKNSEKSIEAVEEKHNNYQQDVVQHFEQTADLVDELTQSYKKVFDHLGQSARQLLTEEQVQEQIEKRKHNKITLAFLAEDDSTETQEELTQDIEEEAIGHSTQQFEQQQPAPFDKEVEEFIADIEAEMETIRQEQATK
ncbi:MAG: YhcB family protein [Proteobacteria bacterium]|nr:YhcB family protein [Pseudomonadota bacterium]